MAPTRTKFYYRRIHYYFSLHIDVLKFYCQQLGIDDTGNYSAKLASYDQKHYKTNCDNYDYSGFDYARFRHAMRNLYGHRFL